MGPSAGVVPAPWHLGDSCCLKEEQRQAASSPLPQRWDPKAENSKLQGRSLGGAGWQGTGWGPRARLAAGEEERPRWGGQMPFWIR